MFSAVILNFTYADVMLFIIMLGIVVVSVIMLSVVMLSVMAYLIHGIYMATISTSNDSSNFIYVTNEIFSF
jgi:hypothetical protein